MTMTERELDGLLGRASVELDRLIAERSQSLGAAGSDEHRADRPRRRVAVAAASLAVVGVGGLIVVSQRDSSDAPATQSSVPPAASAAASQPHTAVTAPPAGSTIEWQRSVEIGSMARSQVLAVAAGEGGFVATGIGVDGGVDRGRVWFSSDGVVWEEPALELFDAKTVASPAALADGFYVLAESDTDRPGLGEGVPPVGDLQVYRSVDGRTWEPWGAPWGDGGMLASTGEVLLRRLQTDPEEWGPVEWSSDGATWNNTTFLDDDASNAYFDVSAGGVTSGDGVSYLRGFRDGSGSAVWSSTDGITWRALAVPPAGGPMVAVPGGLLLASNELMDYCDPVVDGPPSSVPVDTTPPIQRQWECNATRDLYRYDATADAWQSEPPIPAETPSYASLARLGNTVIAALTESAPDKALKVWSTSVDELDWHTVASTRLVYTSNHDGSPGTALIAANNDRIVVITDQQYIDGETAVIVGITP